MEKNNDFINGVRISMLLVGFIMGFRCNITNDNKK